MTLRICLVAVLAAVVAGWMLDAALNATTLHVVVGPPPGTRPVYRYWSSELGSHFYTMSQTEKAKLDSQYAHVWIYEGIAWYAWPDPNSLDATIEEVTP